MRAGGGVAAAGVSDEREERIFAQTWVHKGWLSAVAQAAAAEGVCRTAAREKREKRSDWMGVEVLFLSGWLAHSIQFGRGEWEETSSRIHLRILLLSFFSSSFA
jgi:hypothetical protein